MPGGTASTCEKGARWHLGTGVRRRHRITGGKHRINWISVTEVSVEEEGVATRTACQPERGPARQKAT